MERTAEGGQQVLPGEAGVGAGGGLPHQRGHRVCLRTERGGPRAGTSGRMRVPTGACALSLFSDFAMCCCDIQVFRFGLAFWFGVWFGFWFSFWFRFGFRFFCRFFCSFGLISFWFVWRGCGLVSFCSGRCSSFARVASLWV